MDSDFPYLDGAGERLIRTTNATTACPSLDRIATVLKTVLYEYHNERVTTQKAHNLKQLKITIYAAFALACVPGTLVWAFESAAYGPEARYTINTPLRVILWCRGGEKPSIPPRELKCGTSLAYHTLRDRIEMCLRLVFGLALMVVMWFLLMG